MAIINIPITNGQGSKEIVDGSYGVTASVAGYNDVSINPSSVEVTEGVNSYSFTIAATGTLTLLVTDDGTDIGVPIEGATFVRTDSAGTQYGDEITTNEDGEAVFNNVPYDETNAPLIYYKQTGSDGSHTFDNTVKSTTLLEATKTLNVENPEAVSRSVTLTDANYANLPIDDGNIVLTSN